MTKLTLCLFTIDNKDALDYILSRSNITLSLPYIENNLDLSIQDNLKNLVDSCVRADVNWLKLKIFEIRNVGQDMEILYFGRIPYEYKYMVKNAFFVRPAVTEDQTILKMKYFI
jgi:hypothetical protein